MSAEAMDLIARLEAASGPDRELDAEIMFRLYAKAVGESPIDGGPIGYLWPENNPSWAFGHRFPGKDRDWFSRTRKGHDETLVIEADGALVLMNSMRVPNLTASIDSAMALVPECWDWSAGTGGQGVRGHAFLDCYHGAREDQQVEASAASPALALCIAALSVRSAP